MYKLIIKNIQSIKYAELKNKGITVITGENNLGKSLILKIFYSLVAAKVKEEKVEKILLSEINGFIIKNNENKGIIKLYKNNNLIYDLEITKNKEQISFNEIINNLNVIEYKDVIYLNGISNICDFEGVWDILLLKNEVKYSLKDTILKLKEFNNKIDISKRIDIIKILIENSNSKTLFLIEQPESSLHLNKIEELVKILRTVSDDSNLIITTYNSLLINYLIKENIYLAIKEDKGSIVKENKSIKEILEPHIEPRTKLRKEKFKKIVSNEKSY